MKRLNHLPFLVLCLLLIPALARAGNVSGTVKDLFTRNPVQNVEVRVNNIADTSDVNGNYNLISVPNGRDTITFRPLDYSHLNALHDSLVVSGNQTFNATLPDTTHTNPDNSVVRVKVSELDNCFLHGFKGNVAVWDTKTNKNIPVTIRRFNSSDSTSFWQWLNWRMAQGDTNYFKFIPGTDTLQGIFIKPGSGNQTIAATSGGYIIRAIVELAGFDANIFLHEVTYHAISKPSLHVDRFLSNYMLNPTVRTQSRDLTYMDLIYEWNYATQDGMNNLPLSSLRDSLTVGVEIEPQLVIPVKNELIVKTWPNPVKGDLSVRFVAPEKGVYEVGLYNPLGQCVMHEYHISDSGENEIELSAHRLRAGVYFMRVWDGERCASSRFLVLR